MVTRRFKKGSVYDALASTSGLDFSPVVHLKSYNLRREECTVKNTAVPAPKKPVTNEMCSEVPQKKRSASMDMSIDQQQHHQNQKEQSQNRQQAPSSPRSPKNSRATSMMLSASSNRDHKPHSSQTQSECIATNSSAVSESTCAAESNSQVNCVTSSHEKYPSWPSKVPSPSTSYRSHSWTGQTDYPKEKIVYMRPKKSFKISTNQLQPVLEKSPDTSVNKKPASDSPDITEMQICSSSQSQFGTTTYSDSTTSGSASSKSFDFGPYHSPCVPQCYAEKDYSIHSPPERDTSASSTKSDNDLSTGSCSNTFLNRYEEVLRQQAQYSSPLSSWNRESSSNGSQSRGSGLETPFLDRLRLDNVMASWPQEPPPPPPPPFMVAPAVVAPVHNDIELSSENGTWMGSMESSSHGRGMPKWQGSYSDLSTLSTQLSNRSSLFDSGHSTMPESGRLSPQSSCGSTIASGSLLLEGPTRAQVVARHGCHREIVAHSARVQQPERHGSESVLYYASRPKTALSFNADDPDRPKSPEPGPSGLQFSSLPEEPVHYHRSQACLVFSSAQSGSYSRQAVESAESFHDHSPKQRECRNSNSVSSEDSTVRAKDVSDDTSGSSSDVSNITCISNTCDQSSSPKSEVFGHGGKRSHYGQNYEANDKSKIATQSHRNSDAGCHVQAPGGEGEKFRNSFYRGSVLEPAAAAQYFKQMDGHTRQKSAEESLMIWRGDDGNDGEKRQRVSEPDLKAIQKQAVLSFYQRMSLAESIKSSSSHDGPPPPYELPSPSRLRSSVPKLAILPDRFAQIDGGNAGNGNRKPLKRSDPGPSNLRSGETVVGENKNQSGLLNSHSKSVPNLMSLKNQNFEPATTSQPSTGSKQQQPIWSLGQPSVVKRGSPLAREEIIPWDQLPSVLEKRREAAERAAMAIENKDPPEDGSANNHSSAANYFKGHKSPRKVQLKEVHHANETASIKVITHDGVTLVQTNTDKIFSKNCDKTSGKTTGDNNGKGGQHHQQGPHHKRRPAPPPPPKQPPRRPPPPPPPESPTPDVAATTTALSSSPVVVVLEECNGDVEKELQELKIDENSSTFRTDEGSNRSPSSLSPQLRVGLGREGGDCCSSPDLPLPPHPDSNREAQLVANDEPLPPPPPDANEDLELQNRSLHSTSVVYPKNSYMSYRSEKKLGRQGFDGNYRRSFHSSNSSGDLTDNGYRDSKDDLSPTTWEYLHNIGQHGTTVIFHSDALQQTNQSTSSKKLLQRSTSQDLPQSMMMTNGRIVNGHLLEESEELTKKAKNQPMNGHVTESSTPQRPPSQESRSQNSSIISEDISSSPDRSEDQQRSSDSIVIQCDMGNSDEMSSLENCLFTDDSFVDSSAESDTSSFLSVDQNQNSVDSGKSTSSETTMVPISSNNNKNMINNNSCCGVISSRTNSSTQTTDTPRLKRKNSKTKEELECERLSLNFVHRSGDIALKNLLVPAANQRTMFDYLDGLLGFELESSVSAPNGLTLKEKQQLSEKQNGHMDESGSSSNYSEKGNSLLDLKVKQIHQYIDVVKNQNINGDCELRKLRDELLASIKKKLDHLHNERLVVKERIHHNEKLGKEVTNRVQKSAKPNEIEKFVLHVEEMEKITSLLLSLSGRLAKAENMLGNLPKDSSPQEKKMLEAKRNKLLEQHEDACRLKESIDRRNNQVSTFLHRYLTDEEYADYDHFLKMKIKLIVDTREIDEKINLSEDQLSALRNSVDAHFWRNSIS